MISERKFSKSYTSFWNELLPTADHFVRRLNQSCYRFCKPLESSLPVERDKRAIINELAFRIFLHSIKFGVISDTEKLNLSIKVSEYISKLSSNFKHSGPLNKSEIAEADELSYSLSKYFRDNNTRKIDFWPMFRGCGQMHSCNGDILHGSKLIEVKAGARHFRAIDIRQIIIYLSLNFISQQYDIRNIALVNPRTGLSFDIEIGIFIENCAGRKPVFVFSDIVEFISAEIISP